MASTPTTASPRIRAFPLGETETNAYLVEVPGTPRRCWVVDPGVDPTPIIEAIRSEGLEVEAIILTHAHYDHIAGVDALEAAIGRRRLLLHHAEHAFCSDPRLNLSVYREEPILCRAPDEAIEEGATLRLGDTSWRALHVPGHSPGSVMLVEDRLKVALVGDLVFAGSIGRVDFPTSDPRAMEASLGRLLAEVADDVRLLPGHGPTTTLGEERRRNPFLRPGALR